MNVDSNCGPPQLPVPHSALVLAAVVVSFDWCGFAVVQSCGVWWASDSETVCWRFLVLCDILLGVHGFCCDQWVTLVNHVCPQVSGLHASSGSFVWSWVLEMGARGNRKLGFDWWWWLLHPYQFCGTLWARYCCHFPWGVKLTTHLHAIVRSRMHGAIPPFPHISWCCHA